MKKILIITATALLSSTLYAGGFQAWQQSGYSIGNDAAGAAARADDATTAYYNPAGLTRIKHQDAAFTIIGKIDNHKFRGQATPATPITGYNNSGTLQGGTSHVMPTLFYAAPISDQWGFGFSVATPFENSIDYGRNSYSRYILTHNRLYTSDISPSLAFRPFKPISIGIGFDAQYIRFTYNQVDTDNNNVTGDTLTKNTLTDWAFGWNYGLLYEPFESTRVGISYRSRIDHHATGDSHYGDNRSRAKMHIELPPTTTFSIFQALGQSWDVMATATYTHWRIMNDLKMTGVSAQGGTHTITLANKMRNTWQFILGTDYKIDSAFTARAGAGYDQSPIKNHSRNLIIPDSNRYLLSAGISYAINKTMSVDLGYTHAIYQHKQINNTGTYGNETLTTTGTLDNSADYFGLQYNWLMT